MPVRINWVQSIVQSIKMKFFFESAKLFEAATLKKWTNSSHNETKNDLGTYFISV